MKDTILLVGHGSRHPDGNPEIRRFAEQWREQHPDWRIEICFIEFADVLLDEGLDRAARDADRVIVAPLILNAAGHVKLEIPAHVDKARQRHPDVTFVCARHLGADETILAILERQLRRTLATLDMPDPRTTGVILLGRGSSDPGANGELAKMARWLYEATEHEMVDLAFTGITHPRLESIVQRQVRLGMTQIAVLPYYLFTGTLMARIRRQIERLRCQYPQVAFGLGDYFGFAPEIFELLSRRVHEALGAAAPAPLACDGCRYRQLAEAHGHGHHHHDHHHDDHPQREETHP